MASNIRRVYLDVCALERPYDDRRQLRIAVEADAVQLIMAEVQTGRLALVWSRVPMLEIRSNANHAIRSNLLEFLHGYGIWTEPDANAVGKPVALLMEEGIQVADALHVAMAALTGADFVTCDDRPIRQVVRSGAGLWCGTAPAWCAKEGLA